LKYAVLLLFQFKVIKKNQLNKKRICEERIYHIESSSSECAYNKAEILGKDEEFSYQDGNKLVIFEFIGIQEMIELTDLEDENLVWSRYIEKLLPMERKDKLIPKKGKLTVFKQNKHKLKI